MQIRRWDACNRNDLSWQLCAEVKDARCLRQVKGPVLLWHKLLILKGRLNEKKTQNQAFRLLQEKYSIWMRVCERVRYCLFLKFCDFVKIAEHPQQIHILQLKQHFEAGSHLCCVGFFFSLGMLLPLKSRDGRDPWIKHFPPSRTKVEKSKMQSFIHALVDRYTAAAVTSQALQDCWSVMP